ncbi:hypothetical protein CRG98_011583 [Punica granatum]|uniref:Uncharacterized protein n=1 Tax=Punica granatum TaxID=22663 RepID=A0A2I0KHI5_PUNGR|nr:hypothetical protein CRG98_011583 [Punica granatum]
MSTLKKADGSDYPVHVQEPIISESRRQVCKIRSSTSSQLQEYMDLFKASFKPKPKITPPSSKRSKSVSSPEKPKRNSIEEAMVELNKLKSTIPIEWTVSCREVRITRMYARVRVTRRLECKRNVRLEQAPVVFDVRTSK